MSRVGAKCVNDFVVYIWHQSLKRLRNTAGSSCSRILRMSHLIRLGIGQFWPKESSLYLHRQARIQRYGLRRWGCLFKSVACSQLYMALRKQPGTGCSCSQLPLRTSTQLTRWLRRRVRSAPCSTIQRQQPLFSYTAFRFSIGTNKVIACLCLICIRNAYMYSTLTYIRVTGKMCILTLWYSNPQPNCYSFYCCCFVAKLTFFLTCSPY